MPQPIPPATYSSLCSVFISHLNVSIHTILSARLIYPPNTFLTAKAYDLPIKQSRHPGVCAWINDAVAAVEVELLKGIVSRVVLVIFSAASSSSDGGSSKSADAITGQLNDGDDRKPSSSLENKEGAKPATSSATPGNKPLERYIWDVSKFPTIPKSEIDTPFGREDELSVPPESEQDAQSHPANGRAPSRQPAIEKAHIDMQEQFRGLLSRLSTISGSLKSLPKGCTYSLCIELKDEADPPIGHPQPWIPSEKGLQRTIVHGHEADDGATDSGEQRQNRRRVNEGAELGGVRTTPVRAVDAGEMLFEMWIEEGRAKFQ